MPPNFPALRPFALGAILLSGPAFAQGPAAAGSPPVAPAAAAPNPAGAAASPAAAPATSAFDGYRRFEPQPVAPWRESNDTVGRIGGWKAYAREAQQPAAGAEPAPGRAAPNRGHAH